MPNGFDPVPGLRNVHYTMFEADGIPPAWVEQAFRADLVVLPTEASRLAWESSGVPADKLRVSPLGVDGAAFAAPVPPLPLTAGGRPVDSFGSRFLNVAEPRPRKNQLGLLRAWMEATRPDDDAVLILKMNIFAERAWPAFEADFADLQARIGRTLAGCAPVLFLPYLLPEAHMPALFAAASHYISMSRGEGWDLPMMEAAAAGLTLIAPRHTAYTTYLADDSAHWIPAPLVPAEFEQRLGAEDRIFFEGLNWWDPDVSAAAATIRAIVDGTARPTASPQRRVLDEFTWEAAGRSLLAILFD
jgi:glycosyltransferase involved in cell wall biosynthesis